MSSVQCWQAIGWRPGALAARLSSSSSSSWLKLQLLPLLAQARLTRIRLTSNRAASHRQPKLGGTLFVFARDPLHNYYRHATAEQVLTTVTLLFPPLRTTRLVTLSTCLVSESPPVHPHRQTANWRPLHAASIPNSSLVQTWVVRGSLSRLVTPASRPYCRTSAHFAHPGRS